MGQKFYMNMKMKYDKLNQIEQQSHETLKQGSKADIKPVPQINMRCTKVIFNFAKEPEGKITEKDKKDSICVNAVAWNHCLGFNQYVTVDDWSKLTLYSGPDDKLIT